MSTDEWDDSQTLREVEQVLSMYEGGRQRVDGPATLSSNHGASRANVGLIHRDNSVDDGNEEAVVVDDEEGVVDGNEEGVVDDEEGAVVGRDGSNTTVGDIGPIERDKASLVARISLRQDKAGLEGIDKEKVNNIIYEASKGSKFFENEQRKNAKTQERIARLLHEKESLQSGCAEKLENMRRKVDKYAAQLEAARTFKRTYLHVDMDAFYASVEIRDDPSLLGKPVAVGGMGMLSTASYEARRYGVRSAMPGFIALQLCPQLVLVKPNFDKYREASEKTRVVFSCFDGDFKARSLDEASLDITSYLQSHPDVLPCEVAEIIRKLVYEETNLTCSVGIAPRRPLAKICSDLNKPNGQYELSPSKDAILAFMKELPTRKVGGIGKVTDAQLGALGITQCGHLWEQRALLFMLFRENTASWFLHVAMGFPRESDESGSQVRRERKSISNERTFRDTGDLKTLRNTCEYLSRKVTSRLQAQEMLCGNVSVKLKTHRFEIISRATTLSQPTDKFEDIFTAAATLLEKEMPIRLRLLGVRVSSLSPRQRRRGTGAQQSLQSWLKPQKMTSEQGSTTSLNAKGKDTSSSSSSSSSSSVEVQEGGSVGEEGILRYTTSDPILLARMREEAHAPSKRHPSRCEEAQSGKGKKKRKLKDPRQPPISDFLESST